MRRPTEVDNAESLKPDVVALRDKFLTIGDMENAVLLSHVIKWLSWLIELEAEGGFTDNEWSYK